MPPAAAASSCSPLRIRLRSRRIGLFLQRKVRNQRLPKVDVPLESLDTLPFNKETDMLHFTVSILQAGRTPPPPETAAAPARAEGYLGIEVEEPPEGGAVIAKVAPDSPAA